MKIGIIAGEASGDLLGAGLINALRELDPNLTVEGIGGPLMAKAGCNNLFPSESLAVMGILEPLFHLPELLSIRSKIVKHFKKNPPDIFIGIDSPDFNLGVELKLHNAGIKVVHYVSPSVWAWRPNRIHKIAKATDLVLTLLPFEKKFYDDHKVPATFVGHPLADQIPIDIDRSAARAKLNLDETATYIGLLPGSRHTELKHMGELFAKTALLCWQRNKNIRFIASASNEERSAEFKEYIKKIAPDLPLQFFINQTQDVMAAANVLLVKSGTTTLEAMLMKRPMVIAHKLGFITYQIASALVHVKWIGLPNLLANEKIVPEYIQNDAKPYVLCAALMDYLDHPEKIKSTEDKFTEIHKAIRCDASREAAKAVKELYHGANSRNR